MAAISDLETYELAKSSGETLWIALGVEDGILFDILGIIFVEQADWG